VADGLPREAWSGVQLWLDLVRVPPAVPAPEEERARELLVARYLGGFGPASAADIASFCGWNITTTRAVLARVELCRYRVEPGGELVDVPGAPLPDPGTPAPVRFLGQWDANLLVHVRRAQILPEEYRLRIFGRSMPQSVPTFLVDGQVAGTWRYVDGEVRCEPFHPLPAAAARELADEAERLAAFHAQEGAPGLRASGCRPGSPRGCAARRAAVPGRGPPAR
jgi:hypothetical protein